MPVVELAGLTGRRYIGLPFTDYCPPLAEGPAGLLGLAGALVGWQSAAHAREVVVHGELPAGSGIHLVPRAVRHTLPLSAGSGEPLQRLKTGQVGRAIRKAEREGITASLSTSVHDMPAFCRLHLQTRRRH